MTAKVLLVMMEKLIVILYLISLRSTYASDFFIAKQCRTSNRVCVTNSSFALSWIQDDIKSRLSYEPYFIPSRSRKEFNIEQYFYQRPWSLIGSSLYSNINEAIFDYRWEELTMYMSKYVIEEQSFLKYVPVLRLLKHDFEIPLSIRLKQEGHIFLCDGESPPHSNCYWLMLQAWSGTGSAIRKCGAGSIPITNTWPKEPCSDSLTKINHITNDNSLYLSNEKWSHFKLIKKGNVLSFTRIYHRRNQEKIIELRDQGTPINVTHVIVHSKQFNGLWKIHDIDFIYTTEETEKVQLGEATHPIDTSLCISLFIAMCEDCTITLTLEDDRNNIIEEKVYKNLDSRWSEIKIITENIKRPTQLIKFLVSTTSRSHEKFWAIDNVRICQKHELREIILTEDAKCQLMSDENYVISLSPSAQVTNNNCPEYTIGDFCVPCQWVFETCERIKICKKSECVCSAGSKPNGRYDNECSSDCSDPHYGHGCKKTCDHCLRSECNHIDGMCIHKNGCQGNYTGPKCDILKTLRFSKPPEALNADYFETTVVVSNFTVENGVDEEPHSYLIQYKKANEHTSHWRSAGSTIEFNQSVPITIVNLEVGTKYFLRAVIVSVNNRTYDEESVKFSYFTTHCDELTEKAVMTTTTNTTAIVLINPRFNKSCDFSNYNIRVKSVTVIDPKVKNSTIISFEGLEAFTRYNVLLTGKSDVKFEFKTKEGRPDQITQLIRKNSSDIRIELEWTEPHNLRGNFKHYVVKYKLISYKACGKRLINTTTTSLSFPNNTGIITNLTPYSTYSFSIFAANTELDGSPFTLEIDTKASEIITPEEIPTIKEITSGSTGVRIEFNLICEKSRGPLFAKTSAVCLDDWCDPTRQPQSVNISSDTYGYLDHLIPFSNYSLRLQFCRNHCSALQTREFTTEPEAPDRVGDLLVYSKNASSISLRWTPPHPPNGILKEYFIGCGDKSSTFEPTQCTLWPNFHCATITGLENNRHYSCSIKARNEKPETFGKVLNCRAVTRIESPEAPYDLTINWTLTNDLQLKWRHPNVSNGEIKFFEIKVDCGGYIVDQQFDNVNTKDVYNYTIVSTKIKPSADCTIRISANNGFQSDGVYGKDTSPPVIPEFNIDPVIEPADNVTATVRISLKRMKEKTDHTRILVLISNETDQPDSTLIDFQSFRLVFNCSFDGSTDSYVVVIGDDKPRTECEETGNPPLQPGSKYYISVKLINTFADKTRSQVLKATYETTGTRLTTGPSLQGLVALLLLVPIAAVVYMKKDKFANIKNSLWPREDISGDVLDIKEDSFPLTNTPQHIAIEAQKKVNRLSSTTNPKTKIYSKPIKITEFEGYVKNSIQNGELERQHSLFPRGPTKQWNIASMKENKSKNRYNNLLAYDHSRVILKRIVGDPHSDYINANYIDGHKLPQAYIATQGPKQTTLEDFWRMIWQENVKHIINLANIYEGGKKKVEKYWPNINETLHYGGIVVGHVSTEVFADYEHRIFTVTNNGESRKVEQLHFSSWPDHGVPLYSQSLVPFLKKMLQLPISSRSPIVVHCSAGVGRTGTILLCDICLRMAAREGHIDVLKNLQLLREQRANMVDNIEQYKLAHLVILECLVGLHTAIECNEIKESVEELLANGTNLTLQMRYLKDTQWQDEAMKTVGKSAFQLPIVKEKNRFDDIIPEIQGRIILSRNPPDDENSIYINAIKVDGFRSPDRYIVTQQPMPNTIGDFWRLIDEKNVSVIISLNTINLTDRTSCKYWPSKSNPIMEPIPHITIKYIKTIPEKYYKVVYVHLTTKSRTEHLSVQIISIKDWPSAVTCPRNIEDFLTFWEESESIVRQSHPVVVTCYDGVTASGLYVAMSFVIEKMKLEQVCDVCQAVRTIRHNREQFLQDVEQFKFLYRAAMFYIGGFRPYSNFN